MAVSLSTDRSMPTYEPVVDRFHLRLVHYGAEGTLNCQEASVGAECTSIHDIFPTFAIQNTGK